MVEVDDRLTLETTQPFYGRYYTIVIEKVSAFLLDDLNDSKMEDHPVALSFINSIIKNRRKLETFQSRNKRRRKRRLMTRSKKLRKPTKSK